MRIAILGAGAAGMTAAHLLDPLHEVTVFEAQEAIGGTIRTLGGNVPAPPGCPVLDAGVIEFDAEFFPRVMRLFARLGVATEPVPATTTFFAEDGHRYLPPSLLDHPSLPPTSRLRAWFDGLLYLVRRGERGADTDLPITALEAMTVDEVLGDTPYDTWAELLTMYAYSSPRPQVPQMPAALVIPMLRRFMHAHSWVRVPGGVSTYLDAIMAGLRGSVHVSSPARAVRPGPQGVEVEVQGHPTQRFDAVVFAMPPHRVLPLLPHASEALRACFEPWHGHHIHTVVHNDPGLYRRRGAAFATEFDVFALPGGRGGYNALLDRLCGLSSSDAPGYGLAFGMDDELDPKAILHVQTHDVPIYTVPAFALRDRVRALDGKDGLWFCGAWLGDGLHEGAVSSAAHVAARLGAGPL